jgi:hypothetical protein
MMGQRTTEQKLQDFANLIAEDADYAAAFREMSLEDKAMELLNQDFTQAEIGSLLTNAEQAKDISLQAGVIWAP